MSDVQQEASATAPEANQQPAEVGISRSEPTTGGTDSQLSAAKERCQSQLETLRYQRATAVEGLQKLEAEIEKATLAANAASSTKLTSLHAKRRTFEQRLEELASQEEILTRHLETIAEKERVSSVELHLTARRNAHHEGVAIADKLRSAVGVVEGLHQSWREWSETDRRLKDTLRSLAPERMTELPEFSYATAIDQNFQQAIGQVIREYHRSQNDLQRRLQAKSPV